MGVNDSSTRTLALQTQANELTKQHVVFDGLNRPTVITTAGAAAANGTPCSQVRYQYLGVTSLVTGMIEENATWDSSWDF